jgi:hypothetical protein
MNFVSLGFKGLWDYSFFHLTTTNFLMGKLSMKFVFILNGKNDCDGSFGLLNKHL